MSDRTPNEQANDATSIEETILKLAIDYSGRYWELGNMITAFAVVQMLAFLYALGDKSEFLAKVRESWPLVTWLTGTSGLIYCLLVSLCYYGEFTTLSRRPCLQIFASTSKWAMICRLAIILIMTALGLAVEFLDWIWHPTLYPLQNK